MWWTYSAFAAERTIVLIQNAGGREVTTEGVEWGWLRRREPTLERTCPTASSTTVPRGGSTTGRASCISGTSNGRRPAGAFRVDWRVVNARNVMPDGWEAHVRLHNLADVDEAALCEGVPPEYRGRAGIAAIRLAHAFRREPEYAVPLRHRTVRAQTIHPIRARAGERDRSRGRRRRGRCGGDAHRRTPRCHPDRRDCPAHALRRRQPVWPRGVGAVRRERPGPGATLLRHNA